MQQRKSTPQKKSGAKKPGRPVRRPIPVVDGRAAETRSEKTPRIGSEHELKIDELTHTGEAIGRLGGYVLFVRDALPGEIVKVSVTQAKKQFGRAKLLRILVPSPFRIAPKCKHFGVCGRCSLQHLDYRQQLKVKRDLLRNTLERALPGQRFSVLPMLPLPDSYGSRNKAHFVVGEKNGLAILGHFAAHSKELVPIQECPVHHPATNDAAMAMIASLNAHRIRPFKEDTGKGTARHIVVRASSSANQAIALLVANTDRVDSVHAIAREVMQAAPQTVGVHLNRNPLPGPVVLGSQFTTIAGKDRIVERIADIDFQLSPTAFFQTSAAGARLLVERVLAAVPKNAGSILDLYCGIGLFSLPLARRGHNVLGIEQNPQAVEDAIESAAQNKIVGVEFLAGKTEELLKKLPRERRFDAVVLDPPRDGTPEWVMRLVAHRIRPKTIVDVSCDPDSLARDLKLLTSLGYAIQSIQPIDMFPQTTQVEAVTVLIRQRRPS